MSRAQLRALGIPASTVARWIAAGYLIPTLPRVYAVAHTAGDERSRLFALILFAGPNAALSHGTAAHWRGWLRRPVTLTHLSTPRRIRTRLPGVALHVERAVDRELIDAIPCTTVVQTLLDVAASEPPRLVHRCLAQLDYERRLDPDAIRTACGRGRPGSARLLDALASYLPQLARTRSELEDAFLYLCRAAGVPLPEVNVIVDGLEVDCHWPALGLVVELDGHGNHGTAAQRGRDHRRALRLRARGLTVLRYTPDQVILGASEVIADLQRQIDRLRERAVGLTYPP